MVLVLEIRAQIEIDRTRDGSGKVEGFAARDDETRARHAVQTFIGGGRDRRDRPVREFEGLSAEAAHRIDQ